MRLKSLSRYSILLMNLRHREIFLGRVSVSADDNAAETWIDESDGIVSCAVAINGISVKKMENMIGLRGFNVVDLFCSEFS